MKRRTEAQWRELLTEHELSGMTAVEFCRERGLCSSHFSVRRKQLLAKEGDVSTPSFVPVTLSGRGDVVKGSAMMIELHCGAALQCRVPLSVSADWLADIIRRLRD